MSSTRNDQTIQHPLKTWKHLLYPTPNKLSDAFSLFVIATLTIFTFASISLVVFFAFAYPNSQWFTCPQCDNLLIQTSAVRRYAKVPGHGRPLEADETKTNTSHILFGISGSAKTWNDRRHYSELWWKPYTTRGFVWLDEKPKDDAAWPKTSPPYQVSANTSKFKYTCWYGHRSAIRIARIVKESFELGLENVRWFVMGDDDTVFFTENLVTVLGKYDHNQMYYIGANSESVEQDVVHSYTMAYGGGGFAISYPLAAELVRVLDGCIDRYASFYGSDQKVQGCLSEIGVPVTKELGFHQLDIRGNPYGLLAAHPLAPLVSFHHLDYVSPIFPGQNKIESLKILKTAYDLDPSRTLQHSFCHDLTRNWSVSVSWGYTIQLYPSLLTAKELETALLTFQTWRSWSNGPFTFNTRPMSSDPCKRPILYFLDRVERTGKGQTLTTYRRRYVEGNTCERPDYAGVRAIESFNVSASVFNPDSWRKVKNLSMWQKEGKSMDHPIVLNIAWNHERLNQLNRFNKWHVKATLKELKLTGR